MRRELTAYAAGLCVILSVTGVRAQQEPRRIEASQSEQWVHQQTGLALPPEAAAAGRAQIVDATDKELDIWAQYYHPKDEFVATIYAYRSGIQDVPLWFDRAKIAVENTYLADHAGGLPQPASFTPPGSTQRSALRIAYDLPPGGMLSSTALAVLPLGDWLAKVRISSDRLTAQELNSRMDAFIAALGWPKPEKEAREALALLPCEKPLTFKKAKAVQPNKLQDIQDLAFSRIGALGLGSFCRDRQEGAQWGLYKSQGSQEGYVLAIQDAGRAIGVARRAPIIIDTRGYLVHFFDVAEIAAYPAFNRLPSPEQVMETVQNLDPVLTMSRDANEMTLSTEGSRIE